MGGKESYRRQHLKLHDPAYHEHRNLNKPLNPKAWIVRLRQAHENRAPYLSPACAPSVTGGGGRGYALACASQMCLRAGTTLGGPSPNCSKAITCARMHTLPQVAPSSSGLSATLKTSLVCAFRLWPR